MRQTNVGKAPAGVMCVAVLHYVGAVILVLSGVLKVAVPGGAGLPDTLFPELSMQTGGLAQLAAGLFAFFVGNGLAKGYAWARVTTLIVNALVIFNSLDRLTLVESAYWKLEFGIAVVMSPYLAFSGSASAHFRR